ncbi:MAG: tRNA sulfurtransferase [Candidatus Dormibacteraceae bacterium]
MAPPERIPTLLLRLSGELGTKSPRTRRRFLRRLLDNVRLALGEAQVEGRAHHTWSRVWVETEDPEGAERALACVFGVRGLDRGTQLPFLNQDDLTDQVADQVREHVRGRRFAVRARRLTGATFPAHDLDVSLGAALLEESAGVDLDTPEVTVQVLIGPEQAFCSTEHRDGPAGLPLATGGHALALLSGGFDSPVAAWHLLRRGVELDLVHFDLGAGSSSAALLVAQTLMRRWAPGFQVTVHVVDFQELVAGLRERAPGKVRQILLKRAMYRAAGELARRIGADALVTGEALAQVSTQTLRSLAVCEEAAGGVPVLRPLIGLDKPDIIGLARQVGTHDASAQVQELCAIADGEKVVTWPTVERAQAAEALLDGLGGSAWVHGGLDRRQIVALREWQAPETATDLEVETVPRGALLVDVREPFEGDLVGDLRLPGSVALELLATLDRDREYVLVCPRGQRSRALAGELRRRGYRAWSRRGGLLAQTLPQPVEIRP